MNKPLLVLLLSLMLLGISGAAGAQSRIIRAVNTTIDRGQNGDVSIEIDAQGNENTFGHSIVFDASRLTFVTARLGNGVPASTSFTIDSTQAAIGKVGLLSNCLCHRPLPRGRVNSS